MVEISILVPVYNEELFIEPFFESLSKQKYISRDKIEIIFIDGNSTDNTLQKLKKLTAGSNEFSIRILTNDNRYVSFALNIGLEESKGIYIIRLDVHSIISEDYISQIHNQLTKHSSEYCNFGGRTNARGYDETSLIISKALSNRLVLGGAHFRYSKKRMEVDTVFPGAWLREDLLQVGGWDESWHINEDVELNCRLRKATNKKIIMDPEIVIDYFPRNTLKKLAEQYFKFGYWRIKTARRHEESIRLSHLIPLLFLLMLVIYILLISININLFYVFLFFTAVSYIIYLMILTGKVFEQKEFLKGMATIVVLQFTWILGAFKGYIIFGFPLKGYYQLIKKLLMQKWKFGRKEYI